MFSIHSTVNTWLFLLLCAMAIASSILLLLKTMQFERNQERLKNIIEAYKQTLDGLEYEREETLTRLRETEIAYNDYAKKVKDLTADYKKLKQEKAVESAKQNPLKKLLNQKAKK